MDIPNRFVTMLQDFRPTIDKIIGERKSIGLDTPEDFKLFPLLSYDTHSIAHGMNLLLNPLLPMDDSLTQEQKNAFKYIGQCFDNLRNLRPYSAQSDLHNLEMVCGQRDFSELKESHYEPEAYEKNAEIFLHEAKKIKKALEENISLLPQLIGEEVHRTLMHELDHLQYAAEHVDLIKYLENLSNEWNDTGNIKAFKKKTRLNTRYIMAAEASAFSVQFFRDESYDRSKIPYVQSQTAEKLDMYCQSKFIEPYIKLACYEVTDISPVDAEKLVFYIYAIFDTGMIPREHRIDFLKNSVTYDAEMLGSIQNNIVGKLIDLKEEANALTDEYVKRL